MESSAVRRHLASTLFPVTSTSVLEMVLLESFECTERPFFFSVCLKFHNQFPLCVHLEPSDDEWEEESSSDESDIGPDGLCDGGSSLMSPLCLSAEIHEALITYNIPEKVESSFLESYWFTDAILIERIITLSLTTNANVTQTQLTPLNPSVCSGL